MLWSISMIANQQPREDARLRGGSIIIIIIIIIIYIALFSYPFIALYNNQVNVEPKN